MHYSDEGDAWINTHRRGPLPGAHRSQNKKTKTHLSNPDTYKNSAKAIQCFKDEPGKQPTIMCALSLAKTQTPCKK